MIILYFHHRNFTIVVIGIVFILRRPTLHCTRKSIWKWSVKRYSNNIIMTSFTHTLRHRHTHSCTYSLNATKKNKNRNRQWNEKNLSLKRNIRSKTIHTVLFLLFLCVLKCKNGRRWMPIIIHMAPSGSHTHKHRQCITFDIYYYFSLSFTHSFILFFLCSPHTHTHTHTHTSVKLHLSFYDDNGRRRWWATRKIVIIALSSSSPGGTTTRCNYGRREVIRMCCVRVRVYERSCVGLSAGKQPVKIECGGESGAPYKNPKDCLCRTICGKTSCAPLYNGSRVVFTVVVTI